MGEDDEDYENILFSIADYRSRIEDLKEAINWFNNKIKSI